jgi:DNA-binding transcriptional regulator YiaG
LSPADFRSLRKGLGYTQKGLAEALRMGKHGWQTISNWENDGATIPGPVQVAMEHLAHCPKRERENTRKNRPLSD